MQFEIIPGYNKKCPSSIMTSIRKSNKYVVGGGGDKNNTVSSLEQGVSPSTFDRGQNFMTAYQALKGYKGVTYENINKFLRTHQVGDNLEGFPEAKHKDTDGVKKKLVAFRNVIGNLDDLMKPALPYEGEFITLYRGLSKDFIDLLKNKEYSGVMVNKAFTSCARIPRAATTFATGFGSGYPPLLMITVPASIGRYDMPDQGTMGDNEHETLLERNTQFIFETPIKADKIRTKYEGDLYKCTARKWSA